MKICVRSLLRRWKQLEEARKLIAKLERVIDALNSQVTRLEEEKKTLELRVAELQQQVADLNGEGRGAPEADQETGRSGR